MSGPYEVSGAVLPLACGSVTWVTVVDAMVGSEIAGTLARPVLIYARRVRDPVSSCKPRVE